MYKHKVLISWLLIFALGVFTPGVGLGSHLCLQSGEESVTLFDANASCPETHPETAHTSTAKVCCTVSKGNAAHQQHTSCCALAAPQPSEHSSSCCNVSRGPSSQLSNPTAAFCQSKCCDNEYHYFQLLTHSAEHQPHQWEIVSATGLWVIGAYLASYNCPAAAILPIPPYTPPLISSKQLGNWGAWAGVFRI